MHEARSVFIELDGPNATGKELNRTSDDAYNQNVDIGSVAPGDYVVTIRAYSEPDNGGRELSSGTSLLTVKSNSSNDLSLTLVGEPVYIDLLRAITPYNQKVTIPLVLKDKYGSTVVPDPEKLGYLLNGQPYSLPYLQLTSPGRVALRASYSTTDGQLSDQEFYTPEETELVWDTTVFAPPVNSSWYVGSSDSMDDIAFTKGIYYPRLGQFQPAIHPEKPDLSLTVQAISRDGEMAAGGTGATNFAEFGTTNQYIGFWMQRLGSTFAITFPQDDPPPAFPEGVGCIAGNFIWGPGQYDQGENMHYGHNAVGISFDLKEFTMVDPPDPSYRPRIGGGHLSVTFGSNGTHAIGYSGLFVQRIECPIAGTTFTDCSRSGEIAAGTRTAVGKWYPLFWRPLAGFQTLDVPGEPLCTYEESYVVLQFEDYLPNSTTKVAVLDLQSGRYISLDDFHGGPFWNGPDSSVGYFLRVIDATIFEGRTLNLLITTAENATSNSIKSYVVARLDWLAIKAELQKSERLLDILPM